MILDCVLLRKGKNYWKDARKNMDKFREMSLVNLEGSNLHKRRPRNVAKVHTAVVAKQRKKVLRQAAKKRKAEAIASEAPKRKARKNIPEVATAVAPAPEEAAGERLKKELATNKLEARKPWRKSSRISSRWNLTPLLLTRSRSMSSQRMGGPRRRRIAPRKRWWRSICRCCRRTQSSCRITSPSNYGPPCPLPYLC